MSASDIRGGPSVIPDIADAHTATGLVSGYVAAKKKARPIFGRASIKARCSRQSDQLQTSTRR
jgi:hypothetical protein